MRSLSSVYFGCFSRNVSRRSKVPSSGRPTGKTTSYLPPAGGSLLVTTTSALAASSNIRHAKGIFDSGVGPKFACVVTFLKVIAGNNALPFKHSGSDCGWHTRTPSLNKLIVFAFGLAESRFSTTARTAPCATLILPPSFVRVLLCTRLQVKTSKPMLSSESPTKRFEDAVENPTLRAYLCLCESGMFEYSTTFTSNMYRPLLTPILALTPARRCCMPPSVSDMSTLLPREIKVFSVVSSTKNCAASLFFGFEHAGASTSSSFGGSGGATTAGFTSFASASFCSAPSSVFCFFAGGAAILPTETARPETARPQQGQWIT
mmetsp:Transcript_13557/g.39010  ORF Transcript_13557/g.39010 Transcript_13557/m.39010 type:complete len:319 (-) Transcript_13557:12-968(-)